MVTIHGQEDTERPWAAGGGRPTADGGGARVVALGPRRSLLRQLGAPGLIAGVVDGVA